MLNVRYTWGNGPRYGFPSNKKGGKKPGSGAGGTAGGRPVAPGPNGANGVPQVWQPGDPGAPGIPTPPVSPFLTPEQAQALSDAIRDYEINTGNLEADFTNQSIDTAYQKDQADKQATDSTEAENDDAIRRGIFRSSVRDADLADITAANVTRKSYLTDLLHAAEVKKNTQMDAYKSALNDMKSNYNTLAVQNASAAGADLPPWIKPPTAPSPGRYVPGTIGSAPGKPHGGPAGGKPPASDALAGLNTGPIKQGGNWSWGGSSVVQSSRSTGTAH